MTPQPRSDRAEEAAALYRSGMSLRAIAQVLAVSHETVRLDLLRTLSWRPRSKTISERTREIGTAYLSGGVTLQALADQHGINATAAHRHVMKYRALTGRRA